MSQQTPISPKVAADAVAHFGTRDYPAGSWTHKLMSLMACASPDNRARLATAFPEYAAAVDMAKYDVLGIDNLKHIARGEAA